MNIPSPLKIKATSKNVIPAKAGIHKLLTLLDSRLRGSDKLVMIRGSLNYTTMPHWKGLEVFLSDRIYATSG